MLNWKIWRGPFGGENGFRTQLKDNLYPREDTVKVVCRCRVVSVRDKDLLTGAGHITLLLEVVTRPRSIWCSVTQTLSPPRPDLHTGDAGDGDISMGAYSYIHTLSLASSYYFLRLYGDGNIEN